MCVNKEDQLCWDCQNALGGCPWSACGEAIPGWTAQKTLIPNGCESEYTESYKITACPMFIKDKERLPIVLPGERITIKTLALLLGMKPRTLKSWKDEKIVLAAEKGGLKIEILRKNIRTVKVKNIIRKSRNAIL